MEADMAFIEAARARASLWPLATPIRLLFITLTAPVLLSPEQKLLCFTLYPLSSTYLPVIVAPTLPTATWLQAGTSLSLSHLAHTVWLQTRASRV